MISLVQVVRYHILYMIHLGIVNNSNIAFICPLIFNNCFILVKVAAEAYPGSTMYS